MGRRKERKKEKLGVEEGMLAIKEEGERWSMVWD